MRATGRRRLRRTSPGPSCAARRRSRRYLRRLQRRDVVVRIPAPRRTGRLVELEAQQPDQHQQPDQDDRALDPRVARSGGVVVLDTPGRVAGRGSPHGETSTSASSEGSVRRPSAPGGGGRRSCRRPGTPQRKASPSTSPRVRRPTTYPITTTGDIASASSGGLPVERARDREAAQAQDHADEEEDRERRPDHLGVAALVQQGDGWAADRRRGARRAGDEAGRREGGRVERDLDGVDGQRDSHQHHHRQRHPDLLLGERRHQPGAERRCPVPGRGSDQRRRAPVDVLVLVERGSAPRSVGRATTSAPAPSTARPGRPRVRSSRPSPRPTTACT